MSATKILTRLLGRRKARKSRATLRRRRLLLESLQKREMLAADVSTGNEINSFPLETVTDLSFDEAASVRVLDIDRNGHPDIVSDKGIYLNNGNASSWTTVEFDGEVEDIADMDQDGDLDIVGAGAWYENASGDAQNWIRHGVGIRRDYGPRVVWDPYWDRFRYPNASERPTITGTIATDMDGDGDRDLVMSIADTYASELVNPYYDMVWYENKLNAGQEWEFHSLMPVSGTRVTQIARADLDGNNHEDIIVGFENGNVFYLDNSGTTLTVREVRNKDTDPDQTNGRVNGIDTADVDGDGSLDILVSQGLYYYRGNYTVYTARNDPAKSFEKTVVDEVRTSSHIRGVDINLDGKAELLGGDGNHLYWYDENGSSFDSFQVKGDASIRYQRDAGGADFDGDGDIDLVSVGRKTRIWWNRGGDLSLTSTDVSPDVIGSGQSHEMLQVVARHLGESGNPDLEVASLVFMFDDGTGNIGDNRMSTTEAQGIINELQVYLDDGDGTYSGADQLLTSLANVTLNNGVLTLVLPDGNAGTQLTAGEEKTYWVVLNTKSLAHEHGDLRMTLLTDQGDLAGVASAAEVRSNDTPVELAYTALVSAGIRSAGADLAITLDTSVTNSSGALYNGGRDDLLEISAYYSGAYDVELASIALMLDQGIGGIGEAPLSSSQANALIDRVRIYRDLGQGIGFVDDPSVAELVTTVDTLSLTGGVLVVNLPDGDPSVTFSDQETQTYWVVVDMASNAASARPRTFRMTHLTDESNDVRSIAELASNDSPRKVTDADDISVTVTAGKGVDLDVTRSFAPAIEGQSYTYTVTVQNNGPLDVTKAVVRDFVPDVLIAPVLTDIQVFGGAAGFQSPGLSLVTGIQWSDIVDIPVGGSIEYTVSGTIVAIDAGNQSAYNYTFHRTETALNFPYLDVDNSNDAYSDVINVQLDSRGSLRFQDSNVQLSEGDSNQGDMALGDVDGDGDLDLLIARGSNSYGASSQLLINDGLGNYSDSGLDFGVDGTSSVAMADLDGDGDLDLYIANVASTPFLPVPLSARDRVFFNDGNGNFTASGQELDKVSSYAALAGDLDNDGDIDIVTGSQVQLNDGTGQFTSIAFAYDTIEVSATAELADLDGDGDLDVVDTGSGYGDLQIYWNDGNGVFTSSNQNLPDEVYDVSVGDLDGDGDVDLFVNRIGKQYGSHPSPSMILVNDGKGNFEGDTIEVGGDGVEHISGEIADFDGDGDLDLFVIEWDRLEGTVIPVVFENDGSGAFANVGQAVDSLGYLPTVLVAGDVNGDGGVDVTAVGGTVARVLFNDTQAIAVDESTITVDEGMQASNSGTLNTPGNGTPTLAASIGVISTDEDGNWTWSLDTSTAGISSQTVTITATESDGTSYTSDFELVVNNLPPVLFADVDTVTLNEGLSATFLGFYFDPGNDAVELAASYGTIVGSSDGSWIWTSGVLDAGAATSSQPVTLTATDQDGAVTTKVLQVNVRNVAVSMFPDTQWVFVDEGDTATISGTLDNPLNETLTISSNLGEITDLGNETWTWSWTAGEGNGDTTSFSMFLDDQDVPQQFFYWVTVLNAAPDVAVDHSTVTIESEESAVNSGTISDPGNDAVSLSASVGIIQDNGDGTWSWSLADGKIADTGTITITATDSDGAISTTSFELTVADPAAVVESVVIGDGTEQRSMVTSLTVTFDKEVTLDEGALEITDSVGAIVSLQLDTQVIGGKTVATLTFPDFLGGSLANGSYQLTVRQERVHYKTATMATDYVDDFFRLFGDADGDHDVDADDFTLFKATYRKVYGMDGFDAAFDIDGDGDVDRLDYYYFKRNYA